MNVPHAIQKYLFRQQDIFHHARWLAKANVYLRIFNFHLFYLTKSQRAVLERICQFVLDVYAPMFFSIHTRPSAVEGPALVMLNRNLMKLFQPEIVEHTKSCFLKHATTWMSSRTVALTCHFTNHPVQVTEMSKIFTPSLDTKVCS